MISCSCPWPSPPPPPPPPHTSPFNKTKINVGGGVSANIFFLFGCGYVGGGGGGGGWRRGSTVMRLYGCFQKWVQVEFARYQEILHWKENKELYLISSCLNGLIICTKRKLLIPRNISCELKMHSNSRQCLWVNCFNLQNVGPTMLGYVVLIFCDRLARACKCWANNVAICCI